MLHFSPTWFQPIKLAPIVLTAMVVFGIFLHDTTVDKAALVALPIAAATLSVGFGINEQQHTHVEEVSIGQTLNQFNEAQPRFVKRNDMEDDKLRQKGGLRLDGNSEYHWPSL